VKFLVEVQRNVERLGSGLLGYSASNECQQAATKNGTAKTERRKNGQRPFACVVSNSSSFQQKSTDYVASSREHHYKADRSCTLCKHIALLNQKVQETEYGNPKGN
jgi:tryptophanyl-tRNA synthetase